MKIVLSSLVLVSAMALVGCATTGYKIALKPSAEPGKTITVIKSGFAERGLAIFPLIDAGFYNNGYNESVSEFKNLEADFALKATTNTVARLKEAGFNVVTPQITLAPAQSETLIANSIKTTSWEPFSRIAKEQAAATSSEYVLFEAWKATVNSVSMFGITGNFTIEGQIAVFSNDGVLQGLGSFSGAPVVSGPKDTIPYEISLSRTQAVKDLLVAAFYAQSPAKK